MVRIKQLTFRVLILSISMIGWITCANAQEKIDEVTLTVMGEGNSKQEATTVALRNAIEQTFGTFVSANTAVLNDELIRDEIVTLSSGNVKDYEEIASATLPNGKISVTLKATVVLSKLIAYSESKGFSVEFAGQTFAMNMKLKELNKKNEVEVIKNLCLQLGEIAPYIFDYELQLGEPVRREYYRSKKKYEYYDIETTILLNSNSNTETFHTLFFNTLRSVCLSQSEVEEYRRINLPYHVIDLESGQMEHADRETFCFRSSESIYYMEYFMTYYMTQVIFNFKIVDNLGNSSVLYLVDEATMEKYRVNNSITEYEWTRFLRNSFEWELYPNPQADRKRTIALYILPQGLFDPYIKGSLIDPFWTYPETDIDKGLVWPHLYNRLKAFNEQKSQNATAGQPTTSGGSLLKSVATGVAESFGINIKRKNRKKGKTEEKEQVETKPAPKYICYVIKTHLAIPVDDISKYSNFEIKKLYGE